VKLVELFAGIGGFRVGIEKALQEKTNKTKRNSSGSISIGHSEKQRQQYYDCWANEIDKYACQAYRKQFGEICQQDIRTVDPDSIPDCDIITFGWPCQDNSIAGKRKGQSGDTRSGLLFEAMRIVRAKKPDYFIAENVPGLFSVNKGRDFYKTLRVFAEAGYDCQWQVLNTRWFLPQNRERIYFVGHLRGQPRPEIFPIGEKLETVRQARNGTNNNAGCISTKNQSGQAQWDRGTTLIQVGQIGEKNSMGQRVYDTDGIACSVRSQGGGQGAKTGLYAVSRTPLKYMDRNQKNIEGDYSFTVDGANTGGIKEGSNIRRLSPVECERLQGYSDNFTKFGIDENGKETAISDTQRYKMLGNAVSVPVVQCIAEKLIGEI